MNFIVKFLTILLLLFSLSSCRWFEAASTTMMTFTNIKVPDGTPAFQRGYLDGCSSTIYSRGNQFYRTRYSYKFDPKMIGNSEYTFGHRRGYNWCFKQHVTTDNGGSNASWDRFLMPSGYDKTFNAGNVNEAWGGMFGGIGSPINSPGFQGIFDMWGGGSQGGVFSANPIWAGGSKGQIFGQEYNGF